MASMRRGFVRPDPLFSVFPEGSSCDSQTRADGTDKANVYYYGATIMGIIFLILKDKFVMVGQVG